MGGWSEGASIVALSSVVSSRGSNRQSVYAGSKAALESMISDFSCKLDGKVRVNGIACGAIQTEMLLKLYEESEGLEDRMKRSYPLGIISVEEMCDTIEFLLSDRSEKINGYIMPVDSGFFL